MDITNGYVGNNGLRFISRRENLTTIDDIPTDTEIQQQVQLSLIKILHWQRTKNHGNRNQ